MFEDQSIEGDVAADTALMQRAHHLRQFAHVKTDFGPGRKMLEPEIAGIRTGFDRRAKLGPVARRAHDFGFIRHPSRVAR